MPVCCGLWWATPIQRVHASIHSVHFDTAVDFVFGNASPLLSRVTRDRMQLVRVSRGISRDDQAGVTLNALRLCDLTVAASSLDMSRHATRDASSVTRV